MDGLIGGPIDILELGPFRPGTEGSWIGGALVRIPDDRERSLVTTWPSFYFTSALRDAFFHGLPGACKVRQIKYHALGERYLGSGVVFWPMGQTTHQGCSEKIWHLFPVNAARPLSMIINRCIAK